VVHGPTVSRLDRRILILSPLLLGSLDDGFEARSHFDDGDDGSEIFLMKFSIPHHNFFAWQSLTIFVVQVDFDSGPLGRRLAPASRRHTIRCSSEGWDNAEFGGMEGEAAMKWKSVARSILAYEPCDFLHISSRISHYTPGSSILSPHSCGGELRQQGSRAVLLLHSLLPICV